MHTEYRHPLFSDLLETLLQNTPRSGQFHAAAVAERVLDDISSQHSYPAATLVQKILDAVSEAPVASLQGTEGVLDTTDAAHDLRQLIEDLTESASMPVDAVGEPVHTVEQLSKLFDVSTKTISRWRRQGLIGRKFVIDGRKRVGFLKSSVDRFISSNRKQIERGSRFRQMTNQER